MSDERMREFPALVICKILIRKDALHIEEAYKLHFAVKFTKSTKSDNHIVQLMRSLRVQSQGWGGLCGLLNISLCLYGSISLASKKFIFTLVHLI